MGYGNAPALMGSLLLSHLTRKQDEHLEASGAAVVTPNLVALAMTRPSPTTEPAAAVWTRLVAGLLSRVHGLGLRGS